MAAPLVSICIPAYRSPASMCRLLNSISEQDFSNFEVVITDDSPDNSVQDAVANYKNLPVKYYKNPVVMGSPANWNAAIEKASGQYIKIMHHDDWFTERSSLAKMMKLIDLRQDADLVFSASKNVSADATWIHALDSEHVARLRTQPEILYESNWIGAPSATLFRNRGMYFDSNLKWLVDIEFYIRLLRQNANFHYTAEPLVSIGISNSQVTNACIRDRDINLREYGYVFRKLNLNESESSIQRLIITAKQFDAPPLYLVKLHAPLYPAVKYIVRRLFVSIANRLTSLRNKLLG